MPQTPHRPTTTPDAADEYEPRYYGSSGDSNFYLPAISEFEFSRESEPAELRKPCASVAQARLRVPRVSEAADWLE